MRKLLIFVLLPIVIFTFSSLTPAQNLPESSAQLNPVRDKSLNGVKVLFSPQDNCAREIVLEIEKAQNSIDVAMYFFTSRPLAQAIIRARDRGVKVRVCIAGGEEPGYERYLKSNYLRYNYFVEFGSIFESTPASFVAQSAAKLNGGAGTSQFEKR